ncbi:MAG: J domain-containing protein [Lachnospiraceae bacterium]|nr:J domain-containing protein [Lachnospiraceae bacterium]
MLDPYMVLGVGKYDDDQTVKKSYRALSKQYHPDNNLNNPNKDAAEETFKKIQQAYEQIMHERSIGIGGPNDPGRARAEAEKQAQQNQQQYQQQTQTQNSYNQYNNTRTAEKERPDNSNSWWNSSAFNDNRNRNNYNTGNNGFDQSYNNGYDQNNNSYNNSDYNYGYSQNNQYTGGSGYGNSGGYYTGTGYEYSQNQNQNRNYGGYYSGQADYTNRFNYNTKHNEKDDALMTEAAQAINSKNFFRALDLLNTVKFKNDVWYYYSGVANLGLGNNVTALTHAKIALNMQPNRPEYQELVNCIDSSMMQYQGKSDLFKAQNPHNGSGLCIKLIIANIALNIFCGGSGAICNGVCAVC